MTDNARAVALAALNDVDPGGEFANLASARALRHTDLEARDRRFVTELVHGTTRMRRACDAAIDRFLDRDVEPRVRNALRLGAYQTLFAGVPPHAAVSATVAVAHKPARGLCNAVLRRVAELGPAESVEWETAAEQLSYPDWIVDQLRRDLGDTNAAGALRTMNLAPSAHERPDGYYQDPASQAVVELVGGGPLDRVLDLCAAPGGKATGIAALGADVVAADRNERRLGLVADNARRLECDLDIVAADGTAIPFRDRSFDRVLVDAPCTGLGVLRRRPDARWRVRPRDVTELAEVQLDLVLSAARLVAPGGLLVYSVCTLTAAETIGVDEQLAERLTEWTPVPLPDPPPGGQWEPHGRGALLLPRPEGGDGMFVLRLTAPSG